jgi:hypothetical protein
MDWDLAIERHRGPLLGHVMDLCAKIGFSEGITVERVSRPVYREVLGLLRKAESAVRRLIFVAARNIVLDPPAARPEPAMPKVSSQAKVEAKAEIKVRKPRQRRPLFNLFDAMRRLKGLRRRAKRPRPERRIRILDIGPDPLIPFFIVFREAPQTAPIAAAEIDDGMVSAKHLIRRLIAITEALQDIPHQAMRLARWQALPIEDRRPERWSPLRSGRPPGFRERAKHEIDEILKECDWLARNVMPPLDDTS